MQGGRHALKALLEADEALAEATLAEAGAAVAATDEKDEATELADTPATDATDAALLEYFDASAEAE